MESAAHMVEGPRVAFVVPGGVDAVTGGNLYDTYVIQALQRHGWDVSVIEPSAGERHSDVLVVDSLAFRYGPPSTQAPMVALAHQLPSEANRRPEWAEAERRTLRAASRVVVVADHLRGAIEPMTKAPIDVIPPGRDHAAAREATTLEGTVVLCVANAVPGKGIPEAVAAFAAAEIPNAELLIAGDLEKDEGEARRVRAALGRFHISVRRLGVVTRETLARLYGNARMFLTASSYEGWPIALSEAMASGLPVVGFDAPGVRDLVRSATDGVLVPTGDVAALSGAITDLFADQVRLAEMGRSARERALQWPTWEETGDRFAQVLQDMLG